MVEAIAGFDPAKQAEVGRWPLANALCEYRRHLKREAFKLYTEELDRWNHRACLVKNPGKPPEIPAILRG